MLIGVILASVHIILALDREGTRFYISKAKGMAKVRAWAICNAIAMVNIYKYMDLQSFLLIPGY